MTMLANFAAGELHHILQNIPRHDYAGKFRCW